MSPRLLLIIRLLVGSTFLVAGLLKLVTLAEAAGAETILSRVARGSTVVIGALAVGELFGGLWLLSGQALRIAALLSIVACSGFAGVLVAELRRPDPKPCGCFRTAAVADDPSRIRAQLGGSLGVSVLLGVGSGFLCVGSLRSRASTRAPGVRPPRPIVRLSGAGGFTLIETLVALGMIAVLVAILVPVVSRARAHSQRTVCAANLRTLGQGFVAYAAEHRDWVPRRARYHDPRQPVWPVVVARQLRSRGLDNWGDLAAVSPLQCPSHPTRDIPTAYVLNTFAMETAPQWASSPMVRRSAVRAPASVPWLLETPDLFKTYRNFFDDIFFEPEHVVYSPDHLPGGRTPRVSTERHVGRTANILFADGHVDLWSKANPKLADFDDGIRDRAW